jgi:hypothetical protein
MAGTCLLTPRERALRGRDAGLAERDEITPVPVQSP